MAKLGTQERKDLPDSAFALPDEREFPLTDEEHGRKAIQLLPKSDTTPEEKAKVRAAVKQKFKDITIARKGKK